MVLLVAALGHLSQIGSADATASYAYGISGMRERKSVTTASGTTVTESVWSGMQLLAERDSDGTTYEYIYGTDVPRELVVTPGPGLTGAGIAKRYAYQTDAGGSVIGITDASGAEIARYAYDPFGNPTATSGTDPLAARNPLRYRGYYYDAESGLYYLPARYYEPRSARFLSVDPAAPSAGDPASLNSYVYCQGDPVNASDPTGAVLTEFYRADEQRALGNGNLARGRQKVHDARRTHTGSGGGMHKPDPATKFRKSGSIIGGPLQSVQVLVGVNEVEGSCAALYEASLQWNYSYEWTLNADGSQDIDVTVVTSNAQNCENVSAYFDVSADPSGERARVSGGPNPFTGCAAGGHNSVFTHLSLHTTSNPERILIGCTMGKDGTDPTVVVTLSRTLLEVSNPYTPTPVACH